MEFWSLCNPVGGHLHGSIKGSTFYEDVITDTIDGAVPACTREWIPGSLTLQSVEQLVYLQCISKIILSFFFTRDDEIIEHGSSFVDLLVDICYQTLPVTVE
jgi:hypothetical protein